MLVSLHLRIRLVATSELKARVQDERSRKMRRNFFRRDDGLNPRSTFQDNPSDNEKELSPNALSKSATFSLSSMTGRRLTRSKDSVRSAISELDFREEDTPQSEVDSDSKLDDDDDDDSGWDTTEDHVGPSMISDPGKATPMQRRWLSAMSDGKEFALARRFERYVRSFKFEPTDSDCYALIRINQYFDGKKSDDEILYRAEITRKQLREVLLHYEEYVGILCITDALGPISNFQCSWKHSYIHRKNTYFYPSPNPRFLAYSLYSHTFMVST
jgi:nitrogen permease regulator 3-like protein